MTSLTDLIKDKRPNLSDTSVKTYKSILKNLYEKVFNSDHIDPKKFEESDKIIKFLHTVEPRKRKTILSALVVITGDDNASKKYNHLMIEDINKYNKEEGNQEISEKQSESWIDSDDIKDVYNNLASYAKALYSKQELSIGELQQIQNYIILSLLGGIFIVPRRAKDFVDFKIKNIDKDKDNYLVGNRLVFNSYKTSKTYGRQELIISPILSRILRKWIKINPTEYLLFDTNLTPLTNVQLNQRLNKIFDYKPVGVNQLRHTFLSDKYQDTIKVNKDLAKDLNDMGSSKIQELIYIKKKPIKI